MAPVRLLWIAFAYFLIGWVYAADRYDAYRGNVVGSSRVIGLGGAFGSVAEGIEGSVFNPAGLSQMDSWWDLDLNFGGYRQDYKSRADFLRDTKSQNFHLFIGGALKKKEWHDLAVGVAIYTPYDLQLKGSAVSSGGLTEDVVYKFQYFVGSIPISMKPSERWYVGANLKVTGASMSFASASTNKVSTTATGVGFDLGALYRWSNRQKFSLTYLYGEQLNFERGKNTQVSGFTPFLPADRPHRIFAGTSYQWKPKFRTYFDLGLVSNTQDTLVPGSGLSPSVARIKSGQSFSPAYYLGLEYLFFPGEFEARVGHYFQDARSSIDPLRFHVTGGVDYFFWYIRLGAAGDIAKDYYYFTIGVSPNFSHKDRQRRGSF